MSFSFRQFLVEDSRSAMKVGTDAMLLGSWVKAGSAESILDIGTGCGVIALMMAQSSAAKIDAIDIHKPSADEAAFNISKCPWSERIRVWCRSLEDHALLAKNKYDLIISNPPFFINSLKPASTEKLIAKHEHALSPPELLRYSTGLMHSSSSLCLILPVEEGKKFTLLASELGLYPFRSLTVRPVPLKPPHRSLIEFRFLNVQEPENDELVIHGPDGLFSEKYLSLTQNFHRFNQEKS
ncbi:MAG: methyltransferase [Bacteroidota bacterium]|jgi:tRNA1Val (adenine37-N6)-methyltransferase